MKWTLAAPQDEDRKGERAGEGKREATKETRLIDTQHRSARRGANQIASTDPTIPFYCIIQPRQAQLVLFFLLSLCQPSTLHLYKNGSTHNLPIIRSTSPWSRYNVARVSSLTGRDPISVGVKEERCTQNDRPLPAAFLHAIRVTFFFLFFNFPDRFSSCLVPFTASDVSN